MEIMMIETPYFHEIKLFHETEIETYSSLF